MHRIFLVTDLQMVDLPFYVCAFMLCGGLIATCCFFSRLDLDRSLPPVVEVFEVPPLVEGVGVWIEHPGNSTDLSLGVAVARPPPAEKC